MCLWLMEHWRAVDGARCEEHERCEQCCDVRVPEIFQNSPASSVLTVSPRMVFPLPSNTPLNIVPCWPPSGISDDVVSLNTRSPISRMFAVTVPLPLVNASLRHATKSSMLLISLKSSWHWHSTAALSSTAHALHMRAICTRIRSVKN